jgi:hypothetical protein
VHEVLRARIRHHQRDDLRYCFATVECVGANERQMSASRDIGHLRFRDVRVNSAPMCERSHAPTSATGSDVRSTEANAPIRLVVRAVSHASTSDLR